MQKLAIIIAAYDCAEYIMECVNSVKNQIKVPGWEYDLRIGVDGCKKTADILRKNKIPFYWSAKNHGAYIIRNSLIYLEKADVYSYFDADDVMLNDYLKTQIECLEFGYDSVMLSKYQCDCNLNKLKQKPIMETGGAMAYWYYVIDKLGGYYRHRCACDTDFMERLKLLNNKNNAINYYGKINGYYLRRRHNKSLTKSGVTKYGGAYRKKVWAEMCAQREKGIIKIKPTVVGLEYVG